MQQGLVVRREGQWTLCEGTAAEVARVPAAVAAVTGAANRGAHTRGPAGAGSRQRGGRGICARAVTAGVEDTVKDVKTVCDSVGGATPLHRRYRGDGLAGWDTRGKLPVSAHALPTGAVRAVREHARGRSSTGALASGWRQAMVHEPRRSRPSWPSTSNVGARSNRPCTIGSKWGTGRCGAMRIMKRLQPSTQGWHSWRRYQTIPSSPRRS